MFALLGCRSGSKHPAASLRTASGGGFAFQYRETNFTGFQVSLDKRWTDADNGDDLPDATAPARVRFILQQHLSKYVLQNDPFTDAEVVIIPLRDPSVSDFSKAYSDLTASAAEVRKLIEAGVPKVAPEGSLPEWNLGDAAQAIHAKARTVKGDWCSGIEYLTQHAQDSGAIQNENLMYVFQGLSHDGHDFISVKALIANPLLLKDDPEMGSYTDAQWSDYFLRIEQKLDQAPDGSFAPSLKDLRGMVLSIRSVK
ncbi:MAG: hypothetical protein JST24_11540 [Acidobacteria bacterium]|nr:hypothetical protein [Acidobacteriota bacterium]